MTITYFFNVRCQTVRGKKWQKLVIDVLLHTSDMQQNGADFEVKIQEFV